MSGHLDCNTHQQITDHIKSFRAYTLPGINVKHSSNVQFIQKAMLARKHQQNISSRLSAFIITFPLKTYVLNVIYITQKNIVRRMNRKNKG